MAKIEVVCAIVAAVVALMYTNVAAAALPKPTELTADNFDVETQGACRVPAHTSCAMLCARPNCSAQQRGLGTEWGSGAGGGWDLLGRVYEGALRIVDVETNAVVEAESR